MTFTHLPAIASFIRRTHDSFAGLNIRFIKYVLANAKASCEQNSAIRGITYNAHTNADHGDLDTLVTIYRTPEGAWIYNERVSH